MYIQTPKETNHEIKAKRYTFLLVSNTDVEKSCFLCRVKNPLSTIFNFSQLHDHFQKQPLLDVLRNRCSKKLRNTVF